MSKRQIVLTAGLSTFFTLTLIAGTILLFSSALAAPLSQITPTPIPAVVSYLSVTALAFASVNLETRYQKDPQRQLLSLSGSSAGPTADKRLFIAPLVLPDNTLLTGLTVFGEDFDNQGAVAARLKRCDHSQARCLSLAETTSTNAYAGGQFETPKAAMVNEVVNNYFYSYFLELELTAMSASGLRSARLEVVSAATPPTPSSAQQWALTGSITNFLLPNQGITQVRVCANDLSRLNNATHYPSLVVDRQVIPLESNACVTVWGYTIEIRRELNAGPSTGTYQFLR